MKATKTNEGNKMRIVKFTIKRDTEWDEWIVEVWIDGKINEAKSYHTDDKQDAIDTHIHMKQELIEHPERYQA